MALSYILDAIDDMKLARLVPAEVGNPLQAERHSAGRQELFAFPPESLFTFTGIPNLPLEEKKE